MDVRRGQIRSIVEIQQLIYAFRGYLGKTTAAFPSVLLLFSLCTALCSDTASEKSLHKPQPGGKMRNLFGEEKVYITF
jgi:hypothetical protein